MSKAPESLETYLAQIAHELRDLPASARADELREIESHLRAMIEQRGDVAAVLAQFGKPRKVGRDLRRAWERKQPEAWSRLGIAVLSGLMLLMAFHVVKARSGYFDMPSEVEGEEATTAFMRSLIYNSGVNFFLLIAIGYITRVISPKRGMLAVSLIFMWTFLMKFLRGGFEGADSPAVLPFIPPAFICLLAPVLIGSYFGARHGRRLRFRAAKAE